MGTATLVPVSTPDLPIARAALAYAEDLHRRQVREFDGAPFILHSREVASLLHKAGAPDHLIAAGALVDVIESTPVTAFDLRRRFGSTVASLVLAVREDDSAFGHRQRKGALRHRAAEAGEEALMLFAADKVAKTRELRLEAQRSSGRASRPSIRRLDYYKRCLAFLQTHLPESAIVAELAAELAELGPLRRRARSGLRSERPAP
jgi:(p)ppGpp synthase/HD superfamily hydrolase